MISYRKRDSQKLESMMSVVNGILGSISFKQIEEHYGNLSFNVFSGQADEQIKNKIKIARAMLMDIAKEIK